MNGVVFQTSTSTTLRMSRSGSAVHARGASMMPRLRSRWLMMPNWSLSIQLHIFADTTVGIAHGISTAARTRPRPGNARVRTSAMIMPSTVSIDTVRKVNHSVFLTACHHTLSLNMPYLPVKLSRPFHLAWSRRKRFASVKPSQIVRSSGHAATRPSTISIGARNSHAVRVRLRTSRSRTRALTAAHPVEMRASPLAAPAELVELAGELGDAGLAVLLLVEHRLHGGPERRADLVVLALGRRRRPRHGAGERAEQHRERRVGGEDLLVLVQA